jgi:hypothetical protein
VTRRRERTPLTTRVVLIGVLLVTGAALAVFRLGPVDVEDRVEVAPFMWLFTLLFLVRVAGQVLVAVAAPAWLPPMDDWNLTPYRLLLPAQIVILAVMAWLDVSFAIDTGVSVEPRPALGTTLIVLSAVYGGAMGVRYGVRMARRPSERWFGGTIPIVFHEVLASYVYVLGSFHAA